MSAALLPSAVPPLADRLHSLLRTLPPRCRVTVATLTGWLSITEDPADVTAALDALRAQHRASVEIVQAKGHRPVQWWGP